MKNYLGFDIGASSVKYGIGNCQLGLLHFGSFSIAERSLSCLHQVFRSILEDVNQKWGLDKISAIGIGTPGTIDRESETIVGVNPNLPFWVNRDPRELIPPELKLSVFVDNDANLMCLGEAFHRHPGKKVVGITIGSGIGCGYVQEGEIYHGSHGFAMELGHIIMAIDGAVCNCGRCGCLEAYSSVDGLQRRIWRCLTTEKPELKDQKPWGLRKIIAHKADFPVIDKLVSEGMNYLARAAANLIIVLDPDVLIFGGGAMDAALYDFGMLKETVETFLPQLNIHNCALGKAAHGNRAGVLGAIALAEQSSSGNSE
ncbi:MAG: ROK family protein [Candidatus Cloacimonadaceae bacterium]|nr:ROK family protein [Candidatus Cloacimonadaceae bacterium]MDP3115339.1 ROK family protein [Candidatus Cloacimonadaceae bacterium]